MQGSLDWVGIQEGPREGGGGGGQATRTGSRISKEHKVPSPRPSVSASCYLSYVSQNSKAPRVTRCILEVEYNQFITQPITSNPGALLRTIPPVIRARHYVITANQIVRSERPGAAIVVYLHRPHYSQSSRIYSITYRFLDYMTVS